MLKSLIYSAFSAGQMPVGLPTRVHTNQPAQSQKKARNFKFKKKSDCTILFTHEAKTKALTRWAVTAQLICCFVLTFVKSSLFHDAANVMRRLNYSQCV